MIMSSRGNDMSEAAPAKMIRLKTSEPLVVDVVKGRSRTLVVSLAGVGQERDLAPPAEFFGSATQFGENHAIFVSDINRSWLNHPGIADRLVNLIRVYQRQNDIDNTVLLGNSMGAFSAIVLADLIRVNTVIAFTPQFSACPERMPQETRWSMFREAVTDWRFANVGDMAQEDTGYYIFHGDAPSEKMHWDQFPIRDNVNHYILQGAGHNVARLLQRRGKLKAIIYAAIHRKTRVVRKNLERAVVDDPVEICQREEYPTIGVQALAAESQVA